MAGVSQGLDPQKSTDEDGSNQDTQPSSKRTRLDLSDPGSSAAPQLPALPTWRDPAVLIWNLNPRYATTDNVRHLCSVQGRVTGVKLFDGNTKAIVTMASVGQAKKAVKYVNGQLLWGLKLQAQLVWRRMSVVLMDGDAAEEDDEDDEEDVAPTTEPTSSEGGQAAGNPSIAPPDGSQPSRDPSAASTGPTGNPGAAPGQTAPGDKTA